MKSQLCLALLAAAIAVSGCSSSKSVRKNSGPIKAASFNFVQNPNQGAPGYVDARSEMHSAIQASITSTLAAKGVRRVDSGEHVTVA